MSGNYKDIINLPHPVSPYRAHMGKLDRAAQFSPFAALTGYDAIIAENNRYTDSMAELDEGLIAIINEKILKLQTLKLPQIKVTYFVPDEKKSGGAYVQKEGRLKKIDEFAGLLVFEDKSTVPICRIFAIESEEIN